MLFGLIVKEMVSNRCNEEVASHHFKPLSSLAVNHFKRKQNLVLASEVETELILRSENEAK